MIERPLARHVIDELTALVKSLEEQAVEPTPPDPDLEREYQRLLESDARLRREVNELSEALAELRAAYDALLGQYEASARTTRELEQAHAALVEDRAQAAGQLAAIIARLRS